MLEINDSLVQDIPLAEVVRLPEDVSRIPFDQFVDESDHHLAQAVGSRLPEQRRRMVHGVMDNAVDHIGRVVDGGRDAGLDTAAAVAADVDEQAAALHPLQVLPVDDVVLPAGVPEDGIDNDIILREFGTEQMFGPTVIDGRFRAHVVQRLGGAAGGIPPPQDCGLGTIREHAVAHIGMIHSGFAGDLVVLPERMPSILEHILPRIDSQPALDDGIRDVAVLHGVDPTEDSLPVQLVQILRIPDLGVADDVLGQDLLPAAYPGAGLLIILVRKTEHIAISGFDEYHLRMFDLTDILRNKRPSALVLLMRDREPYGFHWVIY